MEGREEVATWVVREPRGSVEDTSAAACGLAGIGCEERNLTGIKICGVHADARGHGVEGVRAYR